MAFIYFLHTQKSQEYNLWQTSWCYLGHYIHIIQNHANTFRIANQIQAIINHASHSVLVTKYHINHTDGSRLCGRRSLFFYWSCLTKSVCVTGECLDFAHFLSNIIFKLKVCKHFYLRITSGFNADGGYYGSLHFNRQIHKGVLWNWECSLLNRTTPPCKNFNFQCYSISFSC